MVALIAVFSAFSAAGASCAADGFVTFFLTIPDDQEGGSGDESQADNESGRKDRSTLSGGGERAG